MPRFFTDRSGLVRTHLLIKKKCVERGSFSAEIFNEVAVLLNKVSFG
jgi:hypothetical protein